MAVGTVTATIDGKQYPLTFNESTNKWEAVIAAPVKTSYNVNAGHYYPIALTASDGAGNTITEDDTDPVFGEELRLVVKENVPPGSQLLFPTTGASLQNLTPAIHFTLTDKGSGINLESLALTIGDYPLSPIKFNSPGMSYSPTESGYDCTYFLQTALQDMQRCTLILTVSDNDGNYAAPIDTVFSTDTSAPELSVSYPTDSLNTNSTALMISGNVNTAANEQLTISIVVNAQKPISASITDNAFSVPVILQDGLNVITITAFNSSTNKSTQITRNVTLTQAGPIISDIKITPLNTGVVAISMTVTDR